MESLGKSNDGISFKKMDFQSNNPKSDSSYNFLHQQDFKKMLNMDQLRLVNESRQIIHSVLSKDGIKIDSDKREQLIIRSSQQLIHVERNQMLNHLQSGQYLESLEFWKSKSGQDLKYYFILLVCDLMDRDSLIFGSHFCSLLISRIIDNELFNNELICIIYSFLKKILCLDMFSRTRSKFWKYYLRSLQMETKNSQKVFNITKFYITIYRNQIKEIKRKQKKNISEKLQLSSDKKNEERNQSKIIYKNFLSMIVHLIQNIEPEADDFKGLIIPLFIKFMLRSIHFECNETYKNILILLHEKIGKIEGIHLKLKRQKIEINEFISSELNNPILNSSEHEMESVIGESNNTETNQSDSRNNETSINIHYEEVEPLQENKKSSSHGRLKKRRKLIKKKNQNKISKNQKKNKKSEKQLSSDDSFKAKNLRKRKRTKIFD
jgi:hypothetical protein